jgi:hypothetical protein
MIPLVEKAWDLYQATAWFPLETICTATVWLEERYRRAPSSKVAMAIAAHYLILAMRHEAGLKSEVAQESLFNASIIFWTSIAEPPFARLFQVTVLLIELTCQRPLLNGVVSKVNLSGVNGNVIMSGWKDDKPDNARREAIRRNTASISK